MSSKKSLWKSLKKSVQSSTALLCRQCGNANFSLIRTEAADQITLECNRCYREYSLKGQDLVISEQAGNSKKSNGVRWDWSKTDWIPL